MKKINLSQYLKNYFKEGVIDFRIRMFQDKGYIHPLGKDGFTLDFNLDDDLVGINITNKQLEKDLGELIFLLEKLDEIPFELRMKIEFCKKHLGL